MSRESCKGRPTVSVIVPVYNQRRFLKETVACLEGQSWPAVEAIYVDDGSTDGSGAVLDELAGRRGRVVHQPNGGLSAARNTGLRHATGEFVQFLDADDLLSENKLAHHAEYLAAHPGVDLVSCEVSYFRESLRYQRPAEAVQPFDDLLTALLGVNRFQPNSPMVRRSALSRVGMFDERMRACEDWDFWLRCAAAGLEAVFVPGARAFYRLHGRQMSGDPMRMLTGAAAVLERARRLAAERGDRPEDMLALLVSHTTWGLRARAAGCEEMVVALLSHLAEWAKWVPVGLEHPEFTPAEHVLLWTRVLLCLAGDRPKRRRAKHEWRLAAERVKRDPEADGIRALLKAQRMLEGSSLRERLGEVIRQARKLAEKLHADRGWTRARSNGWGQVDEVLKRMREDGQGRIAIYGAGEHTRWLLTEFDLQDFVIAAVVDDEAGLWGREVLGIEVMSPRAAAERGIEAVLVSSDAWEEEMAERAGRLIPRAHIYRMYEPSAGLSRPAVSLRAEEPQIRGWK
ncbi:MAG: glycosyltransferase [Phycisphaerales bacterium]|nr:MAG: glycosyltransferase [Phycisphaerales bacterium]